MTPDPETAEEALQRRTSKLGTAPIGGNGRPQVWNGEGWMDETKGFAPPPVSEKRSMRARTQTRRAREQDVDDVDEGWDEEDDDDDFDDDDDDDDDDFGRHQKSAGKRAKSALDWAARNTSQAPAAAEPAGLNTTADFEPLRDLKGATASDVVGKRIRVWYVAEEPDAAEEPGAEAASGDGTKKCSKLEASVGVVTYFDGRRIHAVYDNDEEFDGFCAQACRLERLSSPAAPSPDMECSRHARRGRWDGRVGVDRAR